jgi:hypothetical protein
MTSSLVFPVLRQVQGVIEVADKCRDDLKDISKYIHTLSAVLVRLLGSFEPGGTWEQSFLNLLEDIFRTVFAALRLADRCILYDGFGFFAKAAAFGLEREVSRVKEQLRVDLESLNSFLLADIWVATKQRGSSAARTCEALCQRQASQAQRLLLSMPKLQTSRHPSKQVAQALAWLRIGNSKAQYKAMSALLRMLGSAQSAAKAADILSAGGVHAIVHHLGSPDPETRDVAIRTLAKLAQAEKASSLPDCPSEVLPSIIACLDSFTYAQASGFVVVERVHQSCSELLLAAVAAAAALQVFAITPANCSAAISSGALPALTDALEAAAATGALPDNEPPPEGAACDVDAQQPPGRQMSRMLLHSNLVQELTRTCHLLMLHDENSKQQLLNLGLMPVLVRILCTQPYLPGTESDAQGSCSAAAVADPAHPQLEAARALVCLASIPAAKADLEAQPAALESLRALATMYQSCFAGGEVASWLGLSPAPADAVGSWPAAAQLQQQHQHQHQQQQVTVLGQRDAGALQAAPASWLPAPCRAVMSATAAASCAVLQVWRGSPPAGQQLPQDGAADEAEQWGISSADVEQMLMDMKLSDMQ